MVQLELTFSFPNGLWEGVVDVNNKTVCLGVSYYYYYEQVACEVNKEFI